MTINFSDNISAHGPGVEVRLSPEDVHRALMAYLAAHGVRIYGAHTARINGELIGDAEIYVDPSGFVMENGTRWSGRGQLE